MNLLQLLLGAKAVGVTTLFLSTVHGTRVEAGVANPADHLVAVILLGQDPEAGLDDSAPESEHQVEGGLLLDVVVRQGPETKKSVYI